MSTYLENIINDVLNNFTLVEVQNYFDGQKYFTEHEIGEIVLDLITSNQLDKVKLVLESASFKKNARCINSCGLPVTQTLLYVIYSLFNSDIEESRKIFLKNEIYSILINPKYNLYWNLVDSNYNTTLHAIAYVANYFTNQELNELIKCAINANVNPLNKNINGFNCIDIFIRKSAKRYKHIITELAACSDNYVIEITKFAYD